MIIGRNFKTSNILPHIDHNDNDIRMIRKITIQLLK